MRIYLLPPIDRDSSPEKLWVRACKTLGFSLILSARVGGIINDRPVVLVADPDVPRAVAVLKGRGSKRQQINGAARTA